MIDSESRHGLVLADVQPLAAEKAGKTFEPATIVAHLGGGWPTVTATVVDTLSPAFLIVNVTV